MFFTKFKILKCQCPYTNEICTQSFSITNYLHNAIFRVQKAVFSFPKAFANFLRQLMATNVLLCVDLLKNIFRVGTFTNRIIAALKIKSSNKKYKKTGFIGIGVAKRLTVHHGLGRVQILA